MEQGQINHIMSQSKGTQTAAALNSCRNTLL